jgi:hypothetical protein
MLRRDIRISHSLSLTLTFSLSHSYVAKRYQDLSLSLSNSHFLSLSQLMKLIEKQLNICCEEISGSSASGTGNADVLGKIFSMVYITRNGLTKAEIWGMVGMVSKYHPDEVRVRVKE